MTKKQVSAEVLIDGTRSQALSEVALKLIDMFVHHVVSGNVVTGDDAQIAFGLLDQDTGMPKSFEHPRHFSCIMIAEEGMAKAISYLIRELIKASESS